MYMKNKLVLLLFFILTGAVSVNAQNLPDQKETLEVMKKVNGYFMKKYADYTIPSFYGRVRPSNIWTRGVYYEGLMALYSIYPREDYYKYAYDWADFHKWGMRNGNTTRNADDHCCGQTYIDLYNICPSDPNMIRNIKASIDMVVNTPQVNDWWWIDAVQMAMPIFAKFGKMTGEQKYYDKMWDMYYYTRSQHDETGMFNQKTVCGGAIRILILPIRSLMERIAIGVVETDGYMLLWCVSWMKFPLTKNTVRTISMTS